jgi:RHS repeat-associated protein
LRPCGPAWLPLVAPESSYNELTVLAAKQRTPEFFPLAATGVSGRGGSLPETRVRGLPIGNRAGVGGCWPVTSTLVWGCGYSCDGTASGSLDQRFYASTYGRFNTPDPKGRKSAKLRNPQSWNRYAYVLGDPINKNDPKGLCYVDANGSSAEDWAYFTDPQYYDSVGYDLGYDGDCSLSYYSIDVPITVGDLTEDVPLGAC